MYCIARLEAVVDKYIIYYTNDIIIDLASSQNYVDQRALHQTQCSVCTPFYYPQDRLKSSIMIVWAQQTYKSSHSQIIPQLRVTSVPPSGKSRAVTTLSGHQFQLKTSKDNQALLLLCWAQTRMTKYASFNYNLSVYREVWK